MDKQTATDAAMMRVVHVNPCTQLGTGGPALSVTSACEAIARLGCQVVICGVDWGPVLGEPTPVDSSLVEVHTVRGLLWPRPRMWLAPTFGRMLRRVAAGAHVMHVHGFWLGLEHSAFKLARRMGIPCVIASRDQLAPPNLLRSAWKKWIARRLYVDRDLRHAACLHATAMHELRQMRDFGLRSPVAVIPNGLDTAPYAAVDPAAASERVGRRWPEAAGKRLMLFLGRLVPKKNPLELVKAWSRLCGRFPDWHLMMTGPDEMGHLKTLQAAAAETGIASRVTFTGPAYENEKLELLGACDLMVLPSLSENFGMSVAEALAAGKPVITTVATPWEELLTYRCGWLIELGAGPLDAALAEALATDRQQMAEMGRRGYRLIHERYSLEQVARQHLDLYRWVTGRGDRPPFVHFDG